MSLKQKIAELESALNEYALEETDYVPSDLTQVMAAKAQALLTQLKSAEIGGDEFCGECFRSFGHKTFHLDKSNGKDKRNGTLYFSHTEPKEQT